MDIRLGDRTVETATEYFLKTDNDAFRKFLPMKARTLAEYLSDFYESLKPGASSFGKAVYADGIHVGDIWIYSIDLNDTPNAMLSYCVFEPEYLNKNVATDAARLFLIDARARFSLKTVGAFTYSDNIPSVRVLEKNGFLKTEDFFEDGRASSYYEKQMG